MSIAPKLRDMHKLGADSCDPEFLDALLEAADEIDRLRGLLEFILQDEPNLMPRASSETRKFIREHLALKD